MKKIHLAYEDDTIFAVDVVRYFRFKNNKYLFYTLNEKDDRGYLTLYVVKVMKELNNFVSQTIRSTNEWNQMKDLVKRILIELKRGQLKVIEDLNSNELDNMIIYESRSFTIAADLAENLSNMSALDNIGFNYSNKKITENHIDNLNKYIETETLNVEEDRKENNSIGEIEVLDL